MESLNGNGPAAIAVDDIHLQEQLKVQVEPVPVPLDQVLQEQQETCREDGRTLLFVP